MSNLYPIDQKLEFGSVLEGDVFARVYIKQRWADAWVERLDILATQILWAAAPATGSASIHRRYGPIVDRGDEAPVNRLPIELGGWYIKIVVTCPDGDRVWHGYVIDVGDEPGGLVNVGNVVYATGKQTWSCVGMLAALDRDVIRDSHWRIQIMGFGATQVMRSAPHFNPTIDDQVQGQSVSRQVPNKHPNHNLFHTQNYIGDNTTPVFWTPRKIVEYLAERASPTDEEGIPVVFLEYNAQQFSTVLPDWGRPELDCHGLTLKQALDRLMNPSTGLGYWLYVKTEEDQATGDITEHLIIHAFTLTPTAIVVDPFVPRELPAAQHITDLFCGNDPSTVYTVQSSLSTRYNRVRVIGARRVVVCTKRFSRDNLTVNWSNGWTVDEENAWFNTPIPAGTNVLDSNQRRLDLLEEGRFHRLYRFFSLRRQAFERNDEDTLPGRPLFVDDDPQTSLPYIPGRYGLAILPDLPLKSGIDYTLANVAATHKQSTAVRRGIAIYGPQHNLGSNSTNPGHDLNGPKIDWANRAHVDLLYNNARPNYQLVPSPYRTALDIGLKIDVSGGSQAVLGGTTAVPTTPPIDTQTLIITLAIEEDRRCQSVYPEDADLPDVDSLLELQLEAGDSYRKVDLRRGTIVGFDHDGLYKTVPEDVALEDDSDELNNIARLAYEWYNRTRSILRLATRRPTARLWPGVLVRDLNPGQAPIDRQVNTTITEIALTLPTNEGVTPGAPRMEVVTSTGDVDFVRYVPRLRV